MATTRPGDGRVLPTKRLSEKISALSGKERMEIMKKTFEQNLFSYKKSSFTAKEGDLFIVTFPKCGTTWTQQIAKLVRNHGQEDGMDVDEAFPWIELMSPEEADVRNVYTYLWKRCYMHVYGIIQKLRSSLTNVLFRTKLGREGADG